MYQTWPEHDKEKRHKIQNQVHEVRKGKDAATNIAVAATASAAYPQQTILVAQPVQPVVQQQPQVIYVTAQQPTTMMPPQQTVMYAQ